MSLKVFVALALLHTAVLAQDKVTVSTSVVGSKYQGSDLTVECSYQITEPGDTVEEVVITRIRNDGSGDDRLYKIKNFENGIAKDIKGYGDTETRYNATSAVNKATLVVKSLDFATDDGSKINCQVESANGGLKTALQAIEVYVEPGQPNVVVLPSDPIVMEHTLMTVTCDGTVGEPSGGEGTSHLQWTRVDTGAPVEGYEVALEVLNNGQVRASSTLTFNATMADDKSKYSCTVKNGDGRGKTAESREIRVKGVVSLTSDHIMTKSKKAGTNKEMTSFTEGDNVVLECEIDPTVHPAPSGISWLYRKKADSTTPNVVSTSPTLKISNINLGSAGIYECKVEQNNNGEFTSASKTVTINVAKKGNTVKDNGNAAAGSVASIFTLVVAMFFTRL